MNTKLLVNRKFTRMFANTLSIVVILALAFPTMGSVYAQGPEPKVGLIATTAGIDDNSFNEMAYQGLLRAVDDLRVSVSTYEPQDQSEYVSLMQQCADENAFCIVVGFEFRFDLPNIARANPAIMWGIIDWSYPDCWEGAEEGVDCGSFTEIPNVRGLRFNEKQAGYLAGVLAGGMTASNTVGAVGGMEIPPVVAFVEGYRNGAQCTNPAVNVLATYTGTFSDPDLGATTAQNMIGQGADVIFGAAGLTGDGAILYSAQNDRWAIGVDTDQYLTVFENGTIPGSDRLLSSAMKRVDSAVYQTIADYVGDNFSSGTIVYDLSTDGVGLAPFNETEDDIPQEVKDNLETVRQGIIDGSVNVDALCPWRDEFDEPLAEPWYWINENADKWGFNDGFLRIYASPYATGGENLLLRPVAPGDFTIKTRVLFEPNTDFQFAGLVLWQDEQNFLQLGRAFCDLEEICVGNGIYFDKIIGGNWVDGNFGTSIGNPADVFLRLERRGDMVRAFYSADEGISWYEIGTHWIPADFQVNAVGLTASQDYNTPDWDIPADFDFFEFTEGWGFLPEGFHDYDQGDVPVWACNAGGWAADPDDRAARLNVDVVVDHQTVASLVAGEFRQDLLDAGVCEGGNCSFSTSLWGVISSYEPHRVDVWAQDNSTGEWVLLNNSAKSLTCRTYDIYTFDPATGTTRQITNLPDMHEFNPRWSPDAKKIVHDAWNTDWSSHGIYITDVATGVSTPLAGADRGSYPTWSPSGKWIAFDRGADEDYRLFILPPAGGTPRLVAEDAFMATWAPNGNRLAFHRPSDGSIRTTTLDGSSVTMVAERGNGPAWSPDGKWIAFEVDGDLWKVGVNNGGNVLGDPIQLTSSPLWEGRPTWSYDSKTIAFHAGMGQDTDIWTIPAAEGMATWLTGAPNFGDYDPNYSLKGQSTYISYASFSPDGQAERSWVSAYTHDAGTWSVGGHNYHFEATWNGGSETTDEIFFNVSAEAQLYVRYALLRPGAVRAGADCAAVDTINPQQFTRFLAGYLTDNPMTYSDAQAYFESLSANAVWDDGQSVELGRHEIIPFNEGDWFNYVCAFTEAPPKMDLRVNYGHDWVESFYEAGHAVSIQVTDGEGNVKATAEVVTESKDYWGGGTGFQSADSAWFDADGNQLESPPDIQPNDWVYAQVDNGATAQVQIGDISGMIDLENDSIEGTINAPWITERVQVECLDWGSGQDPPFETIQDGSILTDGSESYSCSWDGWDIQYYQNVGVGYFTPDGHWVANAFFVRNPHFSVFPEWEYVEGWEWPDGVTVTATIEGKSDCFAEGTAGYGGDPITFVQMWFPQGCDAVVGDVVTLTDNVTTRQHTIRNLAVTGVNADDDTVSGTADTGAQVHVWPHGYNELLPTADVDGNWTADFTETGPDLVGGMAGRTEIRDEMGNATAVEWGVPGTLFVTGTEDVIANDGVCTLREAVIAAKANAPSGEAIGECPAGSEFATDTILLAANQTYSLTISGSDEDGSYTGDLDILDNSAATDLIIMVEGNGNATISQDASVDDRVLENHGATVHLEGLTLTGGGNVQIGGGVHNVGGTLIMSADTVTGNTADYGGGIYNDTSGTLILTGSTISGNTANVDGGGLENGGSLTVDASTFTANSATYGGGALATYMGTVTIQNGSLFGGDPDAGQGNTANYGGGIAIWSGNLNLTDSTVSGNSVTWVGGGIKNGADGTVIVNDSTISNNSAEWDAGGLYNEGTMTVHASVVSGNTSTYQGGGLGNFEGDLTISASTISGNSSGNGGGVKNWPNSTLVIDASTLAGNSAGGGGGLANEGATATIQNGSQFTDNTVGWMGGAITNDSGGTLLVEGSSIISGNSSNGFGGGLYNDQASTLTVNNSKIAKNVSVYGGGGIRNEGMLTVDHSVLLANLSQAGGALDNTGTATIQNGTLVGGATAEDANIADGGGGLFNVGTLTVKDSIVTGNHAADYGGGLFNWIGGMLTINNSTVSNNSANEGGGLHNKEDSTTVIQNSIFSGNYAEFAGGGLQNWGTLIVMESVLLGNTSPGEGDAIISSVDAENATSITGSCIVDNGDTAVFNSLPAFQNFTGNWWGDASGPSGFGPGTGDSVSDYIDFSGWLSDPPAICAP